MEPDYSDSHPSLMQRLQHRLRVGFCDTQQRAVGAFGTEAALFLVLEGAGTDADESGIVILAQTEFLRTDFASGQLGWCCARVSFSAKAGTAFLEAGGMDFLINDRAESTSCASFPLDGIRG